MVTTLGVKQHPLQCYVYGIICLYACSIVFATVWWQHDNAIPNLTAGPNGHGSSCGAQTFAQRSVNSCDAVCTAGNVLRVVKLHCQYEDDIREYVEEGKGGGEHHKT